MEFKWRKPFLKKIYTLSVILKCVKKTQAYFPPANIHSQNKLEPCLSLIKYAIAEIHFHLVKKCSQLIFTVTRKISISEKKQDKTDLVVSEHKARLQKIHMKMTQPQKTHTHKL